jgi:membrane protein DedA with SNARE-associated domain
VLEDFVRNLYTSLGYGGVVLAMAIESCCIPLPSELIMPFAGALTVSSVAQSLKISNTFSLWGVALAGALGCVLGSLLAYWIGAAGGRPLVSRFGRYVLLSERDVDWAERFFERRGQITIFLSRIMPVVRTFISLPAGFTHMALGPFVLLTFVGSLIWCAILAYAGQKLGQHWTDVGGWLHKYEYVVIAAIIVLIVLYVRHRLAARRSGAIT